MFKNVAGQYVEVLAIDTATNKPKTGDAANITVYIIKDHGTATALTDTSATEVDATNAKGLYRFDVSQSETNCDMATFTGKSSTSGIEIIPVTFLMRPANATALSIDSSGRVDVIKLAGTTCTARDIGASVLLSSGTGTGQISLSSGAVLLQPTQTGVTIPTVTTTVNVTNNNDKSGYSLNVSPPTAAQVATAVWQDTTAGDFTVVGSIGKSLYTSGNAPGAASGLALVGSNMGTITGGTINTVSDKTGYSVSGTITTLDALNTSLSTTHGAGSWATATGFSTLDASGVRSAVGLASANLDTQLDALPTAAENSTAVWAAVTRSLTDKSGFSLATAPPTADENAAALLDLANAIESGLTVRQAMRLIVAADAGKVSGGGTTTVTIRDIADTKDRIVATVDSDGNRTAITRDLT